MIETARDSFRNAILDLRVEEGPSVLEKYKNEFQQYSQHIFKH